jgi:hypothetical protein
MSCGGSVFVDFDESRRGEIAPNMVLDAETVSVLSPVSAAP